MERSKFDGLKTTPQEKIKSTSFNVEKSTQDLQREQKGSQVALEPLAATNDAGETIHFKDTPLPYQGGVISSDPVTLRLAAQQFEQTFGDKIYVPKVVEESEGRAFARLAKIEIKGRKISVTINTDKMTWDESYTVAKEDFCGYDRKWHQTATFQDGGRVVKVGEVYVSRQLMRTPDKERVYAWFAQVLPAQAEDVGRYELISTVEQLAQEYNTRFEKGEGDHYDEICVPAVQTAYKSDLPEIVAANSSVLESAKQNIKLALDYTGARTSAYSEFLTLGGSGPFERFEFGAGGPVAYWFTKINDMTPFAPTLTKPEAWLGLGNSANFDF
jgi:hypothetical protein